MKPTIAFLSGVVLSITVSGCYASGRPPEDARAAAKNVEVGTGKLLEGTGDLVEAGVNSAEEDWKTPQDRRRSQE
ncbi:MAG: hypothetical protein IT290_04190 [Deltaproteobacteria bacterium]|nr:hypothetical protein [Deltaproteobacteria bacterium]